MDASKMGLDRFIAEVIIPGKTSGQQMCFILGSGASKTSGIPTGGELEMDWMNHMMSQSDSYKGELRTLAEKLYRTGDIDHDFRGIEKEWQDAVSKEKTTLPSDYYFDLFVLRFHGIPGGGIRELQRRMGDCEPGLGYCVLSLLLTQDNCRNNIVITTNFDSLVEKAVFAFTNRTPVSVSHEALVDSMSWKVRYPIVAKVHRDLMFSPLNSTKEIKALKEPWRKPLQQVLDDYVPIVIGYAGADDSLMSFMEEDATKFPNGLYWCFRENSEPSERVKRLVGKKGGSLVPIKGFDELMVGISLYNGPDEGLIDSAFLDKLENRYKAIVKEFKEKRDKIAAAKPATAEDFFNRGYRYVMEGKYEDAIADFSQAIALKPDYSRAYYNRGCAYDDMGNHEAAIPDYDKVLTFKPNNSEDYYTRGNLYQQQGDYKAAIADFTQAITLKPDYPEAYNNRGIAYILSGDYKASIADYDKALALKPDYPEAYFNRGNTYALSGDYKAAIADFTQAIALKPDFLKAYNNRGIAYDNLGDHKAAEADFKKAHELEDPARF